MGEKRMAHVTISGEILVHVRVLEIVVMRKRWAGIPE